MILRGNFHSETLRMSTNIQVLLPDKGDAPFRIVYLLHGQHGDQGTWLDYTSLPYFAKKYNAIFVMPEVARSFYSDLIYGRKYFTYVSEELPEVCKKFFNFSSGREDTAVMGCSMGGYGALKLALTKPEKYGFCGPIAPACLHFRPMLESLSRDPEPYLKSGKEAQESYIDMKMLFGENLEYRDEYEILDLIKKFPDNKPKPVIYATCGTEDNLRHESLALCDTIKGRSFDFTYEEWTGNHEWDFFSDALKKAIEFWYRGYKA